jgi:hypothetical protein
LPAIDSWAGPQWEMARRLRSSTTSESSQERPRLQNCSNPRRRFEQSKTTCHCFVYSTGVVGFQSCQHILGCIRQDRANMIL